MYFYFKGTNEARKLYPNSCAEVWIGYAFDKYPIFILETIIEAIVILIIISVFCL